MSYSDIHITHIHIAEDLSVAVQSHVQSCFNDCITSQGHSEMPLCGDQSELFVCWWGLF